MINHKKWISSLPKINKEISKTINQLDHENSINSIPKKDSYNSVKKYTLLTVLFICGLIFVSIVKNFFNLYSNLRKNPSRYLPIEEKKSDLFKLILKKPLIADVKEINKNIRSRSAKLRYAIRNDNSFFYPYEFKNKFINYLKLESNKI